MTSSRGFLMVSQVPRDLQWVSLPFKWISEEQSTPGSMRKASSGQQDMIANNRLVPCLDCELALGNSTTLSKSVQTKLKLWLRSLTTDI